MFVDAVASAWARQMPDIDWNDTTLYYTEYERENAGWDEIPIKDGTD
jgi:hypothetical protein